MTEFIWVASFPKSGSTWMRYILAHLLFDAAEDKSKIREMIPNIHDWDGPIRYEWMGAYPVKTHLARHNVPPRMKTRSAIYLVRNPLDMIDSAVAYFSPESEAGVQKMIDEFCQDGSVEPWGKLLGYGSWEENLESWTESPASFPQLFMKYEDMLSDPHHAIRQVAEFVGKDVDDATVEKVFSESNRLVLHTYRHCWNG